MKGDTDSSSALSVVVVCCRFCCLDAVEVGVMLAVANAEASLLLCRFLDGMLAKYRVASSLLLGCFQLQRDSRLLDYDGDCEEDQ